MNIVKLDNKCQFKKGNNQNVNLEIKNEQAKKFLSLFEDFSDEEELKENKSVCPKKKEEQTQKSPSPQRVEKLQKNSSKKEIPSMVKFCQDTSFYHPSIKINNNFQFKIASRPTEIISSDHSKQSEIIQSKQIKISNSLKGQNRDTSLLFKEENLYEQNIILLLKLRHLPRFQLSNKINDLKDKILKTYDIQLLKNFDEKINRINFRRLSQNTQTNENELELIIFYFQNNYPSRTKNDDFEKWLQEQYPLVKWKVDYLNIMFKMIKDQSLLKRVSVNDNLLSLVNELEYRFYIQYILQERTIIQKIKTQDEALSQHLILLIQEVIYSQKQRIILKLSDGWAFLLMVVDDNNDNILFRLLKEMKIIKELLSRCLQLHLINSSIYPIKIPESSEFLILTPINSIKKAKPHSKLGQQKQLYFLRTISNIRKNGGFVPCLDVFILAKSQLLTGFNQKRKIMEVIEEEIVTVPKKNKKQIDTYSFILYIIDAIHYFEKTEVDKKSVIQINIIYCTIQQYLNVNQGDRIKIINSYPLNNGLEVKQTKTSGIIYNDEIIQQYKEYAFQQMENWIHLIEDLSIDLTDDRLYSIVIWVQRVHENKIFGITSNDQMVTIEMHSSFFFEKNAELINKIVAINYLEYNNKKLKTSYLTKFQQLNQNCSVKYQKSFRLLEKKYLN